MINPDTFQTIPDAVSHNINSMQAFAINRIATDIRKNHSLSGTSQNLFDAIQRTNLFDVDFKAELAIMVELSLEEIDVIFAEAVTEAYISDKQAYEITKTPMPEYKDNAYLQQLTRAMSAQTKETFINLTQTRAIGFTDKQGKFIDHRKYLQSRLQQTEFNVVNGVQSYDQAIRETVKEMTNSGLKYFDYESGHRDTVEVATRRAILTGITQLAGQVSAYNLTQLNARHVQTSRHVGARTGSGLGDIADHSAWQGKVYSLSDDFFIEFADGQMPPQSDVKEKYPDFIEYCGYGEGNGIGGWNCRHSWSLFFPEFQKPFYDEKQLEELTKEESIKRPFTYIDGRGHEVTKEFDIYDQTQELRRRERAMRKSRSIAVGLKAGGDTDGYQQYKNQYHTQKKEYERFLKEMNFKADGMTRLNKSGFMHTNQLQSRVWIDGLGRI